MADSVGKARSTSKEKALDARIREIQLRSRASEERQKVIRNEARTARPAKANGDNKESKAEESSAGASEPKKSQSGKPKREWDTGKTPASDWKTNVPEMDARRLVRSTKNGSTDPDKSTAVFQHDDRFNDKPGRKKRTPDENRKSSSGGVQQRNNSESKRSPFMRSTNSNRKDGQKEDSVVKPIAQLRNRMNRLNLSGNLKGETTSGGDQMKPSQKYTRNRRRRQNKTDEEDEHSSRPEQRAPRRPRQNKADQGESSSERQSNNTPGRKIIKIRPNRRNVPDRVQVRQVVRQLIGRVCMLERREKLGLPKIEQESEV